MDSFLKLIAMVMIFAVIYFTVSISPRNGVCEAPAVSNSQP